MNKKTDIRQSSNKLQRNDKKRTGDKLSKAIKLQIVYPPEGFASADDNMDVIVNAIRDKDHCDHKQVVAQARIETKVDIVLDAKVVATASNKKGKKATYVAKIKLKYISEGSHKLQAVFSHNNTTETTKTAISESINLIVDRTPPFIRLIPFDNLITEKDDGTSDITVEAEDIHSGLNVEKCSLAVDDIILESPLKTENGLVFQLKSQLGKGKHKTELILFDMADNMVKHQSEFSIAKKDVSTLREGSKAKTRANINNEIHPRESLLNNLREKLVIDQKFLRKWLNNPRDTAAEIGISYTDEMEKYLTPAPTGKHIDFSIDAEDENIQNALTAIMTRVSTVIRKKTPSNLETLQKEGVCLKNRELTSSAKRTINATLQDPIGMLKSIGIALTDKEKKAIFPPFSKKDAEALTKWISIVQSDKP